MQRGQTTLEFLMILGAALLILLVTITISNEQGSALSTRKAELQASLAATDIGNAAREVYAQGIGARKLATVTLPRSYNASQSGVYSNYLKIRAGRTDYIETFPFPVTGSLPGRPGMFEFLVENDGGTVSIGRWLAYANTSAIDATIYGGESYYESIALSSLSSTDSNVTIACTWEDGPVTIDCQNTSFALAGHASVPFSIGFSASEAAFGVHSGTVNVTVQGALGNQSIEIPVSVSILEVYGELSTKIVFLSPTPAKGTSITFAQLGASPVVVNASISGISLSDLRYTVANSEYRYYDDSLAAMYNFDENAALGESAGTVADVSRYGNNASVYDGVKLLFHMDEADGNTSLDGSAHRNNGILYGNTAVLLHFDEGTGATSYDESANRNNGTCTNMATVNGANSCNWVSGKNGTGILFDGIDDTFTIPASARTKIVGDMALGAWIRRANTTGTSPEGIICSEGTGGYVLELSWNSNTNRLCFITPNANALCSNSQITDTQWHHVFATYSNSVASLYIDGVLDRSGASSGSITGTSTPIYVGQRSGAAFFSGIIDEVGIYNRSVSAPEVFAQYNASRAKHIDWVEGKSGTALKFDGADDYVVTGSSASLNISRTLSASAWVWQDSTAANSAGSTRVISLSGRNDGIDFKTGNDGQFVVVAVHPGGITTWTVVRSVPMNSWAHLAATFDGATLKAYVNGALASEAAANSSTININTNQVYLSSQSDGYSPFKGMLDEVAIYNRTLTPLEIFEQFSTGKATHPESVEGVYGKALKFDGIDDYLQGYVPSPIGTGDYSISVWFKKPAKDVQFYLTSPTSDAALGNYSFPHVRAISGGVWLQRHPMSAIYMSFTPDTNWHQAVFIRRSGTVYGYLDGVDKNIPQGDEFSNQSGFNFTGTSFYTGRFYYSGANYSTSGSIDEVRIWNRALSAAEVRQQYYSNLAKVSPNSWLFSSTHSQLDSRRYDYALFAKDVDGQYDRASRHIYSTYNTIGFVPSTPSSGASESSASLLYDPLAVNASIANAALSQASISWQGSNYSLFDSNLVAAYDFDNNAALGENSTLFVDSSNNGFNGTCSGDSCPSIVEGKYGSALYFDGFEDYVNLSASMPSFGGTQPFAIEMWVNLSSENVMPYLISRWNGNVDGEYYIRIYGNRSIVLHREASTPTKVYSEVLLAEDSWHHIVAGFNGTHSQVFLDGVLAGSVTASSCGGAATTQVMLGAVQSSNVIRPSFDGMMDAVRIYNRSLSADEVALHYYSNLAKYDSRKWLLASNPATPAGAYSYAGFALDSAGWNSTGTRSYSSVYNRVGFIAPTPANGSTANLTAASANGLPINVSVVDANPSRLYFEWNGANASFYDDSLLLAYNFDNASGVGDTDERVTDLSRYGNTGSVSSNVLTLHFDESDGAYTSDSGPNRINPVVYGDTVLLLRMNESAGSVAYDNSRYANNATCYHGAAIADCNFTSGLSGNAISFDGNSDHMRIPYAPAFNFTTAMSAFAWVKAGPQCSKDVMGQYQYDTNKRRWRIRSACTGANNQLSVSLSADGTTNQMKQYTTVDAVFDNNWHHVGFTWASGALTLYVDGQVAQVSQSDYAMTRLYPSDVDFTIGSVLASNVTSENLLGLIDEVALYNRSLSASEVAGHYAARKAKFSEWDLDGKSGSAMTFDGVTDYVSVQNGTNAPFRQSSQVTYSFWAKMPLNGGGNVMGAGCAGGQGYGGVYLDLNNFFFRWTPTTPQVDRTIANNQSLGISSDEWNQFVVTVDFVGKVTSMYVNGNAIVTGLPYGTPTNWVPVTSYNSGKPDMIGGRFINSWYYFNGSIDEVAIYNASLSASEILQMYYEGRPKHLNYVGGKYGAAVSFDGVDDYVLPANASGLNSPSGIAVEAWVMADNLTGDHRIVSKTESGGYALYLYNSVPTFSVHVVGEYVAATCPSIVSGKWYHLLGTFNGTTVSCYENGVAGTPAQRSGSITSNSQVVLVGAEPNGAALSTMFFFSGSIDGVRIWNRSVSAAEAMQHYYGNLAKYAPERWLLSSSAVANEPGDYSYAAYLRGTDGTWNSTGTRTVAVTNSTTVSFISPTPADGAGISSSAYPVRAAVAGVSNLSSFHIFAGDSAYSFYDDSLLLSLSFDNVTYPSYYNSTLERDSSKYGNNGRLTGSPYPVDGRYGQAKYFNGSSYITVPRSASLEPASGLTVEAWVNPATYNMPDYVKQIVEKYYPDTSPTGYYLGMRCPDPAWTTSCARGVFVFEVRNGTQYGSNYAFASNVTIVPNTWYHVVGTAGNGFVRIYVNGELAASRPLVGSLNYADVRDMHIGADYVLTSGRFWAGSIDEVRVWGRALSAGEVLSHYNSNFAKFAPDKWLFEATAIGVHPGVEELRVLARDSSNNTYSDRRAISAVSGQVEFAGPTPSEKRANASIAAMPYYPLTVNATVSNISLANLTFRWGSSNVSLYNDSLVLAYNFDNVESNGDSAGVVKDVSRYGNNGAISGNTMILLHLDENSGSVVYDESKNRNNGTCYSGASATNCSFVAGISGAGLFFDGTDDYVDLGSSVPIFASGATLSAWIRTNSTADVMNIVSRWTASSGKRGPRIMVTSGLLSFQATTDGEVTTAYNLAGLRRVSDGKWHHVAATYDGSQIRLYVDGSLDNSAEARKGILYSGSGNFVLGRQGTDSVQYFNGSIDEVLVVNRSLSASEILEQYAAVRARHPDWTADGKYCGAMTFDGVDDSIQTNFNIGAQVRNMTFSAWVYARPTTGYSTIFSDGTTWTNGTRVWIDYNNQLMFYVANGTTYLGYQPVVKYGEYLNRWTHLAVSFEYFNNGSGVSSVYLNGQQLRNSFGTAGAPNPSNEKLVLGRIGTCCWNLNGMLDEVRLWNRTLSREEMDVVYRSSLNKFAPDKWLFTYSVPTDLAPVSYDYAVYANDFLADGADWGAYSGRKRITPFTDRISFIGQTPANTSSISSATAAFEPVQLNASIGNASLSQATVNWNLTNLSLYDSSLVLMYNFDKVASIGDNASYVVDSSLYANNGTVIGMVNFSSDGPFGKAASFDGVWDYITAPSSTSLNFGTGDFAVAFWMKPVKFNTSQGLVRKVAPETLWGDGWFIESTGDASNTIRFETRPNDAAIRSRRVNSSSAIPSGVWTYVTAVRAGTAMRIYLNGMLDAENATGVIDNVTSNASVIVGSSPQDSDRYFEGPIDEVRIWNRSLSGREVYESYAANLAHTGPGRWAFSANKSVAGVNGYSFYGFAGEPSGSNLTSRTFSTSNNRIGFLSPTPADGSAIQSSAAFANGIQVNASVVNANLSAFKFSWNGTGAYYLDDNLVLAYNFDNAPAAGDSAQRVTDYSRYKNNGTASSALLALHFDGENGSTAYDSAGGSNGLIYGDTLLLMSFDEAEGKSVSDKSRFANNGTVYGNTRLLLHFDEAAGSVTYDDSAYLNNATCYNMNGSTGITPCNWSTGKSGAGITFDGNDDYLNISNSNSLTMSTNDLTLEAWVKRNDNPADNPGILAKKNAGGADANRGYALGVLQSGSGYGSFKPWMSLGDGTYYEDYYPSNSSDIVPLGQWTHVAAAYSFASHSAQFYINGVPVATTKSSSGNITNLSESNPMLIGKANYAAYNLNGSLDEIGVYSKALPASEILAHYAAGKAKHSGWVAGKNGTGLYFDGANDYLHVPESSSMDASSAVTVEAWVNFDGIQMGYAGIVDKRQAYRLRTGSNYKMYFDMQLTNGTWFDSNPSNSVIMPYAWHHLVATYDRYAPYGNVNYYIDGVLDRQFTFSGQIINAASAFSIGRLDNVQMFKGSIDEVAVYNRSLSADEVAVHYAAGRARLLERGEGRVGDGLVLNGTGEYLNVTGPVSALQVNSSFTFSGWIKPRKVGYTNPVIEWGAYYGGLQGIRVQQNSAGSLYGFAGSGSSRPMEYSDSVVPYDQWTHFAFQWNGTHLNMYLNGVLQSAPSAFAGPLSYNGNYFYVGKEGNNYFNGSLDEIALYNQSLSASEILQMYEEGVPKHLNYVDGKYGKAVQFDGVRDFVSVPNSAALNPSGSISLEAWVRSDALGGRQTIFSKDATLNTEPYYQYHLEVRSTGELYFALSLSGTRYSLDCTGFGVTPGRWHHVVATYDGSALRIYRDGAVYSSQIAASGSISQYATDLQIGRIYVAGSDLAYFKGSIDEARVWNRSLSASEIQQHYYSNLAKYSTDRWLFSSSQPVTSAGNYSFFASIMDVNGSWNSTGTRTVQVVQPNPVGFAPPTPADGSDLYGELVQVKGTLSNVSSLDTLKLLVGDSVTSLYDDSLVLAYNFDNVASLGENATRVVDVSRLGSNGVLLNGTAWTSSGKYGGGLAFDGANDFVLVNSSAYMFNSGSFSATVWANAAALDGGYDGLLSVDIAGDSAWKIKRDAGNTYFRGRFASTTLDYPQVNVNEWHQYGLVKSGTTLNLYFDGVLVASAACAATHALVGTSLVIGSYRVNDAYGGYHIFNGSMDEVRIWNRSLSADEIRQQYDSNLAKFAPDKWLFQLNQSNLATKQYEVRAFARDLSNNSYSDRRFFNAYANKILFSSPTPIRRFFSTIGAGAAEPFAINASLRNISLSRLDFNFNGTNHSLYNDSLVLAYNFDDVQGIGDSATKVVDVSKYGNNGTIAGNTMLMLRMDEGNGTTAYDESRFGNNGTCYSAGSVATCSWTNGQSLSGISLDGSDDFINISSVGIIPGDVSISIWFKVFSVPAGYAPRITDLSQASTYGLQIAVRNTDGRVYLDNSGGPSTSVLGPVVNDSNWHHVVEVRNGINYHFYVDGVYQGYTTGTVPAYTYLVLGRLLSGYYFNGTIDEVMVANRSISSDEVLSQYNAGKAKHADWTPDGKWGSAIKFDGVDDYILTPSSNSLGLSSFTVQAWVRPEQNAGSSNWQYLVGKNGATDIERPYMLWWEESYRRFAGYIGNGTVTQSVSSSFYLPKQVWYHVAFSANGTNLCLYINSQGTCAIQTALPLVNSRELVIASNNGTGYRFTGSMDEVRIWNRSLSAVEVAQQYYGSLNKYAADKWVFTSTQSNASATFGTYNYSLYSTDANGAPSFSGRRVVFNDFGRIGFVSPTPPSGSVISLASASTGQVLINASISGISAPRSMGFTYDGTNTVIQNDSLLLAYNFDDVSAIGDSAGKVVDSSKYGNNGTVYGNTRLLLRLDEDTGSVAYDESRFGNNGSISGAIRVAGKSGAGLQFDGTDDYLSVPSSSSLSFNTSFAIMAWFKTTKNTGYGTIFNKDSSGMGYNQNYHLRQNGGVLLSRIGNGTTSCDLAGTRQISDGQWHHGVAMWNGTNMQIYVDGTHDNSRVCTLTPYVNNDPVRIGIWGGAGEAFNGTIDEAAIFNGSLSAADVAQFYAAGRARHANWNPDGKYGSAMTFDGVDDYVESTAFPALTAESFTISAWINASSFTNAYSSELAIVSDGSADGSSWYGVTIISNGLIRFRTYDTANRYLDSSSNLSAGKWYHVVAVWDKDLRKSIYINGVLDSSDTSSVGIGGDSAGIRIGKNSYSYPNVFNGSIDEVRIWNRSLSAAEVTQQYYSNLAKYAPGKWLFSYQPFLNSTGSHTFSASVRDDAYAYNSSDFRSFTVSAADKIAFISPTPADGANSRFGNITINASIANISLSKMAFSWNGTNYSYLDSSLVLAYNFDDNTAAGDTAGKAADYSSYGNNGTIAGNTLLLMHMDEGDGNTSKDESVTGSNGTIYGNTVALLRMNEGSGSVAYDESAYKNNGSCIYTNGTGRLCSWATGKSGSGVYLDDLSMVYLGGPATINTTRAVTASAWVNLGDTDALSAIYSKGYYYGNYHGIELRRHTDNYFHFFIGNGTNICNIRSDSLVAANTWYHVAGVYTGATAYIYVNGVLQSYTCNISAPIAFEPNMDSFVGAGAGNYLGIIDEFGLYNRSLSSAEILDQYNYGKAKHAEWAAGKSGAGLQFDGADDYVGVPYSSALAPTNQITVEAWANSANWNSGTYVVVSKTESGGYELYSNSTHFMFEIRRNGAYADATILTSSLSSGWHHFVGTYDGRYACLYVDGFLANTNDAGSTYPIQYSYNNSLLIGAEAGQGAAANPGYYFNGSIDEVGIYSRTLSAEEVAAHYNAGKAHHDSWDPNGKWGSALKTGTFGSYVAVLDQPEFNFGSSMTAMLWTNGGPGSSSENYLLAKYGASQSSLLLAKSSSGPGRLMAYVYANGSDIAGAFRYQLSNAVVFDGNWHYVGFVWNGTSIVLYEDGQAISSTAGGNLSINSMFRSTSSFCIGGICGKSFNGSIDEVRVWNRALSADEVAQQYYSNLQKVAPDRWIFTTSRNVTPTGGIGVPYSVWVRDDRTWLTNESVRVINRQ